MAILLMTIASSEAGENKGGPENKPAPKLNLPETEVVIGDVASVDYGLEIPDQPSVISPAFEPQRLNDSNIGPVINRPLTEKNQGGGIESEEITPIKHNKLSDVGGLELKPEAQPGSAEQGAENDILERYGNGEYDQIIKVEYQNGAELTMKHKKTGKYVKIFILKDGKMRAKYISDNDGGLAEGAGKYLASN